MKSIELTKEHKSKLLEMCKKLFPEFKKGGNFYLINHLHTPGEYEATIGELTPAETNFIQFYNFAGKKEKNETVDEHFAKWFGSIHWFEFCMTHLINKLRDLLLKQNLITVGSSDSPWQVKQLMSAFYNVNYHPIDYLYEEFKKLKNEQNRTKEKDIS